MYSPKRHSKCYNPQAPSDLSNANSSFCDIALIDLELPDPLRQELVTIANDVKSGKYVSLPGWKGGRTVDTRELISKIPEMESFYLDTVTQTVSDMVRQAVSGTPLNLPTSCALLVYEKPGDFINWHYDVNYYKGRFFTLLIPVTIDNVCTKFTFRHNANTNVKVTIDQGKALLFEGDHVFHMASPLCSGEQRILLSMQFVTDPRISKWDTFFRNLKDIAYIGVP